jgi:hypothetical protein
MMLYDAQVLVYTSLLVNNTDAVEPNLSHRCAETVANTDNCFSDLSNPQIIIVYWMLSQDSLIRWI